MRRSQRVGTVRVLGLAGGLFLLGVATRAPMVGAHLANWDAVQYALGLTAFDVVRHQPHPPGSILYVALGRAAMWFTGDAQGALAAISVVAGGAGVALCYVLGRMLFGARIALAGTVLYACSPLTWYYGAVALPYALEGALTLGAVALLWRAAEERRLGAALGAAVVLAVAGGVRQTTMLLLLPLWLYATWRACRLPPLRGIWRGEVERGEVWRRGRGLLAGLALLVVLCLGWAVPLLVLSGGVGEYVGASRRLSSLVSGLTSVFVVGMPAMAWNVSYLLEVGAMGLTAAIAPFAVLLVPGVGWPWRPTPAQTWFLRLWAGPALLVYVALHVGQAGYLLLLWPLVCLAAGTAALVAAEVLRWRAGALVGGLGLVSAGMFLFSPLFGATTTGLTRDAIRENDRELRGVADLVQSFPVGEVAILTGTQSRESFRLATYYFPEVMVYAVGLDREGDLGVAFAGLRGEHTYAEFMAGAPAARRLPLAPRTRNLLILDESVMRLFPPDAVRELTVTPARRVWQWPAWTDGAPLGELVVRWPLGEGPYTAGR